MSLLTVRNSHMTVSGGSLNSPSAKVEIIRLFTATLAASDFGNRSRKPLGGFTTPSRIKKIRLFAKMNF